MSNKDIEKAAVEVPKTYNRPEKKYSHFDLQAVISGSNTGHMGEKYSFSIRELATKRFILSIGVNETVTLPISAIEHLIESLNNFSMLMKMRDERKGELGLGSQ